MSDWYYAEGGDKRGPVSVDKLIEFLKGQRDGQSILVWREGLEDWTEAGALTELSKFIAAPPKSVSDSRPVPTETPPRNWTHTIIGWAVVVFSLALSKLLGSVFWIPVLLIALSWWLFTKIKLHDYIAVMLGILVGHTLWMIVGHAALLNANQPDPDLLLSSFEFFVVFVLMIWAIRTQSVAACVCVLVYQLVVLGAHFLSLDELAKESVAGAFMHIGLRVIGIAAVIYAIVRARQLKREQGAGALTA